LDSSAIVFIISSFALGILLIVNRERIPGKLRRGMAAIAVLLILFSFVLIVYSFLSAGM
jgi:hypothetical protein